MGERGVERWCRVAGVWDRSALSPFACPHSAMPQATSFLSLRRAGLQPCSQSSMLVCGQHTPAASDEPANFARIIRRRCWRRAGPWWAYAAGVRHATGPLQPCNVPGPAGESERPSPCPQLRTSWRVSPASRLSLEPAPFAPSAQCEAGNCTRCSPAACVEGGLLSTDASLVVRPSRLARPRRPGGLQYQTVRLLRYQPRSQPAREPPTAFCHAPQGREGRHVSRLFFLGSLRPQ